MSENLTEKRKVKCCIKLLKLLNWFTQQISRKLKMGNHLKIAYIRSLTSPLMVDLYELPTFLHHANY